MGETMMGSSYPPLGGPDDNTLFAGGYHDDDIRTGIMSAETHPANGVADFVSSPHANVDDMFMEMTNEEPDRDENVNVSGPIDNLGDLEKNGGDGVSLPRIRSPSPAPFVEEQASLVMEKMRSSPEPTDAITDGALSELLPMDES